MASPVAITPAPAFPEAEFPPVCARTTASFLISAALRLFTERSPEKISQSGQVEFKNKEFLKSRSPNRDEKIFKKAMNPSEPVKVLLTILTIFAEAFASPVAITAEPELLSALFSPVAAVEVASVATSAALLFSTPTLSDVGAASSEEAEPPLGGSASKFPTLISLVLTVFSTVTSDCASPVSITVSSTCAKAAFKKRTPKTSAKSAIFLPKLKPSEKSSEKVFEKFIILILFDIVNFNFGFFFYNHWPASWRGRRSRRRVRHRVSNKGQE